MRIELDITKSVQQNAERFFESSKKAKRKARGTKDAIERMREQGVESSEPEQQSAEKRPHRWFMDYRWHVTASGVLCVGGRTAETNERVIKKYANPKDRIFHTDVQGSPFYVARTRGRELLESEAVGIASSCASFSRAWKYRLLSIEVFEVSPDQVTKRARAGEYVATGSFMVYGERTYHEGRLELYATLVVIDDAPFVMMSGEELPESYARIAPGDLSPSDTAKELARDVDVPLSEIERSLPPGDCRVEHLRKPRERVFGTVE